MTLSHSKHLKIEQHQKLQYDVIGGPTCIYFFLQLIVVLEIYLLDNIEHEFRFLVHDIEQFRYHTIIVSMYPLVMTGRRFSFIKRFYF